MSEESANYESNRRQPPDVREQAASQLPAIRLLTACGWSLMTPADSVRERDGRVSQPVMIGVLRRWLTQHNRIEWKGEQADFTDANIERAISRLVDSPFAGLMPANEERTERLLLGTSLSQTVSGDTKSFPLQYIDWDRPERNWFNVVPEFEITRTGSSKRCFIDLVLFVNGIPLGTIECKAPGVGTTRKTPADLAVEQTCRNWQIDYVPRLFGTVQLTLAVADTAQAKYGTAGTPANQWGFWRERQKELSGLDEAVNKAAPAEVIAMLRTIPDFAANYDRLDGIMTCQRPPTSQDELIFGICRPERLLRMASRYSVFSGGNKVVARWQQFFCVGKLLRRVQTRLPDGRRKGGVVWHTQGSGKSLTMVMLARGLAEELPKMGATDVRVVVVTDRVDLDEQIGRTFAKCGQNPVRATTGKHLSELLRTPKARVITTIINKFEAAVRHGERIENEDIFVLVDEGHRTQFGTLSARMEQKLPMACMIAFTGTPVNTRINKENKSTVREFGGLADTYTINEANEDGAVVPLKYEGREVPLEVDRKRIDSWLDRKTTGLTDKQKADLKQKFASKSMLTSAEQRVAMIAYDVAGHFRSRFQGTGFKGQLVAPDKATAIKYGQLLQDAGISAEVLISPPDDREGEDGELAKRAEAKAEVREFWKRMMERFGDPDAYQDKLIASFSAGGDPEILVVVSKLLVGFDAPRNSVLYLARRLKDHTLLQAIARVNRLHQDKSEGMIVDYEGVIKNLDEAIQDYAKRAAMGDDFDFDVSELKGMVVSIEDTIKKLPSLREDLYRFFPGLEDRSDLESFERKLDDVAKREEFYETLTDFSRTFGRAMATVSFLENTSEKNINRYKADFKFFQTLRGRLKHRHQEVVAFGEYEAEIKHLIDQHVGADEVETVVPEIPLFDDKRREEELEKLDSDSSKADAIVGRMKRTISEKWDENPAFYQRFSDMLTEVIAKWRNDRRLEKEYLARVRESLEQLKTEGADSGPAELENRDAARAYFGIVDSLVVRESAGEPFVISAAKTIDNALSDPPVDWARNPDYLNQVSQQIDEQLFDLSDETGVPLTGEQIDAIIEQCLVVAKKRAGESS